MNHIWTVQYCEGWNGPEGRPIGDITEGEARSRDIDGLPYSVVVSKGSRPRFVLDIAWRQGHLARWTLDEHGRRSTRAVFIRLEDGTLFERKLTEWAYEEGDTDGDSGVPRVTFKRQFDGNTFIHHRRRRGSGHTSRRESPQQFMRPGVLFGDWRSLLDGVPDALPQAEDVLAHLPFKVGDARPWTPPSPLAAPYLDRLLTIYEDLVHRDAEEELTVDHQTVATVNFPTGQVVARDPRWFDVHDAFTTRIQPGRYDIIEIQLRRMLSEDEAPTPVAYLLKVSDHPTVAWEMALQPGQDLRTLDDGHFYGFGVDSGFGSFMDHAAQQPLNDYVGDDYEWTDDPYGERYFAIPETDLDLFAYQCYYGDGSYPTWIGRDADGAVTCFLSDMLVVSDGSPPKRRERAFEDDW